MLNDSIKALFAFDTGATGCTITDDIAKKLGIFDERDALNRTTDTKSFPRPKHIVFPLSVQTSDSVEFYYSEIWSLPNEYREYEGIFGPNYGQKEKVIEINFEHHRINLIPCDSLHLKNTDIILTYQNSPIQGLVPIVEFPFELLVETDTLKFNYHLTLDLGAPYGLIFINTPDKIQQLSGHNIKYPVQYQTTNDINDESMYMFISRIKMSVQNKHEFSDILIAYTNRNNDFLDSKKTLRSQGMLGVDFLKHYNIFIHPKSQNIILRKHAEKFVTQMPAMSNIGFCINDRTNKVSWIVEGSPIDSTDLQIDDRILLFNGFDYGTISSKIKDSLCLSLPANVPLQLEIERNGSVLNFVSRTYSNPLHQ